MNLTRITQYEGRLKGKRAGLLAAALLLTFFSYAQPIANFSASDSAGCAGLPVKFTNLSTSTDIGAAQVIWDLGNGTISTQKDASTIYSTPGVYTVKLTVRDATGEDTEIKENFITIYANPDIDFSASPPTGCIPLTVTFTDLTDVGSGSIQNWVWDFGDGSNSSSEQNPVHTYNTPGSYNVSLLVVSSNGCQSSIIKQAVVTPVDSVHADFTYDYTNICNPPTIVNFTNTSTSQSPLSYKWDFGNGSTSQDQDPSQTYSTSGNYSVQLIATNDAGCADTVTHSISIGNITADFTFPNGLCVNEPALMTDASSTVPISATWDFGDGTTGTGLSVTHTYTATGTYTVKYTADFDGCTSVIDKVITVTGKPTAAFTSASVLTACQAPLTVQFSNTSTDAVSYEWDFGDGTISTEISPLHTYTTTGNFTVKLTAISAGGCRQTYTRTNYVRINQPNISGFTNLPFNGCASSTVPFKAIVSSPEPISTYLWNFGDGTTSSEEAPEHIYNNTGTYNVTLTVTTTSGCTDTYTFTAAVIISSKPTADFTAEPLTGCASDEVQFRDQSTGDVDKWSWQFGDGGRNSSPNPLYHYSDTGRFTVTLIVQSGGCSDTAIKTDLIFIYGTVAAMNITDYCDTPYLKRFEDASVAAETWSWNFGDGTTSTDQNTVHTYAAPGTYTVQLIVTNGSCADTTTQTLNVIDEHPTSSIKPLVGNLCKNNSIQFVAGNLNMANVKGIRWIFADGTSTSFNIQNDTITHTYKNAGVFDPVQMIVNYINGCYDTVKTPVTIIGPTAAFTNGPGTCAGNLFTFTDQSTPYSSTYPITTWVWDYGDGTIETSTAPPYDHSYADSGTYNVLLKVYDNLGCYDSVYKPASVIIGKPYADFSIKDPLRCTSSEVEFVNKSAGLSLQYSWNFGDGTTSTSASPTHLYTTEGQYSVSLTVTDIYGCTNTITKTDSITISNPVAAFSLSDDYSRCTLPVQFTNASQNYSNLTWDFGDGGISVLEDPFHLYTIPNTYTITLTAQGYGECYATATQQVTLEGPYGTLESSNNDGCFPLTVNFTANATNTVGYIWDFGDGVLEETTVDTRSYTYNTPGNFVPRILLKDISGCTVAIELGDTAHINGVIPKFYAIPQTGCDSSLVQFTDTSYVVADPIASTLWNYGDGSSSSDPFHYYKQTGNYTVTQTVTSAAGCSSTFTLPITVTVNTAPKIKISLPDSACVNSNYSFIATDTSTLTETLQWLWNIGNGVQSAEQNFDYTYTTPGVYDVSIMATSAVTACADTVTKRVTILALPPVYAGNDTAICINTTATLNPSGASSYVWAVSPSLSCTDCTNPLAAPVESTTYYVTGSDNFGCKATDSVWVRVVTPTQLSLSVTADTLCLGASIQLNASGAEIYTWTPPAGLSSTTVPDPVASPTVSTIYQVVGGDSIGCFEDTQYVNLFVAPLPTFNIRDSNVTVSAGSSYTIVTTSSPDVTTWFWDPPAGLTTPASAQPVATPKFAATYKGVATNAFGCSDFDTIRIEVLCNNSNVFIPNTFSPNGDGSNDYFLPLGKGLFNIKSMKIFNRWGVQVFQKINFTVSRENGWDGTFSGAAQPSDVYVYVVDVVCENGVILSYKGNVTLLR